MIPGYDFYAEEEGPSPYRWVVISSGGREIGSAPAYGMDDEAEAARQLALRRKIYRSYTVKLLKDGQVWEPGQ